MASCNLSAGTTMSSPLQAIASALARSRTAFFVMKLFKPSFVVKATADMGFAEPTIVPLGAVLLTCTLLYIIPRTAILGAILLTGYLGGAVAAHVRHGDGAFPILFPVIFGAILWGGLVLRDRRLGPLILWRP